MSLPKLELFSIIVPAYNRSNALLSALESVRHQTYRPIQLIIIDDGSTDNTRSVVKGWTESIADPESLRVEYYYQENSGPSAARNHGIRHVRGELVQFLDSDDFIHPTRLTVLVEHFSTTGADYIQTGFNGFDPESGVITDQHYGRQGENQLELALKGLLWANTLRAALRRDLVERAGPWDTEMSCFEDREYMERAVVLAEHPVAIREILASARRGGGERVSDRLRSYEGRKHRILCEERLAERTMERADVSYQSKQAFASRLYGLGIRCNARGWPDHAARCGEIASSMDVQLDRKGKVRQRVWESGWVGAKAYLLAGRIKSYLQTYRGG